MFKRLLLCFDGSNGAQRAADMALGLAAEQEAFVQLVSIIERLPHYAATVGEAADEHDRAEGFFRNVQKGVLQRASELGVMIESQIVGGNAPQAIVHIAEQGGYDLVVLGHSGHSEIWGRFMGTTADKVTRHAPCSVLIVR